MKTEMHAQHACEQRRVDIAIMTALILCILPITLAVALDFGRSGKKTGDYLEIINGEDVVLPADLGELLFPFDDFKTVGLSEDSSVVGFISALPVETACMEVDRGMKSAGWKALPSQGKGIISYSRVSSYGGVESQYSYALVLVNEVKEGTSIVVRLM